MKLKIKALQGLTLLTAGAMITGVISVYGLYNGTPTYAEEYEEPAAPIATVEPEKTNGTYFDDNRILHFYAAELKPYRYDEYHLAISEDESRYDSATGKAWYNSVGWKTTSDNISSDVMTYSTNLSGNKVIVRRITPQEVVKNVMGELVDVIEVNGWREVWGYEKTDASYQVNPWHVYYYPWYNCFTANNAIDKLLLLGWNRETNWTPGEEEHLSLSTELYELKDGMYTDVDNSKSNSSEHYQASYSILSADNGTVDVLTKFEINDEYGLALSQIAEVCGMNKEDAAEIRKIINDAVKKLEETLERDHYSDYFTCKHDKLHIKTPFSGVESSNSAIIQMYKNHGIGNAIDFQTWTDYCGDTGHDKDMFLNRVGMSAHALSGGTWYNCWCGEAHSALPSSTFDKLIKEWTNHTFNDSLMGNTVVDAQVCWCGQVHTADKTSDNWFEKWIEINFTDEYHNSCQNEWQEFNISNWDCGWKRQGSISYKLDLVGHGETIRIQLKT